MLLRAFEVGGTVKTKEYVLTVRASIPLFYMSRSDSPCPALILWTRSDSDLRSIHHDRYHFSSVKAFCDT